MSNVRYNITPELVAEQVAKKLAQHAATRIRIHAQSAETHARYNEDVKAGKSKRWARPPDDPAYIDPMMDEWEARERDYYAKVRVIKLAPKKFILVYGNEKDTTVKHGTGPFKTLTECCNWFLNGGR
jgi:hypothetical protein